MFGTRMDVIGEISSAVQATNIVITELSVMDRNTTSNVLVFSDQDAQLGFDTGPEQLQITNNLNVPSSGPWSTARSYGRRPSFHNTRLERSHS